MNIDPEDFYSSGGRSDCCDARIIGEDICSECGEHCSPLEDEEEDES